MIGENDADWFGPIDVKPSPPLPVDRPLGSFGDGPLPPLARALLKAWTADKPRHDRASLSTWLAGATFFRGPRAMVATRAYLLVVDDVLGCLVEAGRIVKDVAGWYALTNDGKARAQT